MTTEDAGPQGAFTGPEPEGAKANTFVIEVTNAPYFGMGPEKAYVALNSNNWCYLTSDPTAAVSCSGWIDSSQRKFIATPNGWLSYQGSTPYYAGAWQSVSNSYQTWIADGTLSFDGGVLCFYSDGSNTWLYNQNVGTVGYTPCTVLPATAP